MPKHFNLLDEPWLPVRLADGENVDVGLRDLFARANEIRALSDTEPPSLIAQYRVLLAIVHSALTQSLGKWTDRQRAQWYENGLPIQDILGYLAHWQDRFWLFHDEHPFMQVAVLAHAEETRDKLKPWTQVGLAHATGNTPAVFDHSVDSQPTAVPPARGLRSLLGFLQFTPGGLVKTFRDSDKAGALANTAASLPMGETLSKTLCLALHAASRDGVNDIPAWQQPSVTLAQLKADAVLATGPNDRYTRLSRAVQFVPEEDGSIRWLRFGAGLALADDVNAPDPMASYREGSVGKVRLTFTEGRAFWRDLPSLLPNPSGKTSPAAVLQSAANLQAHLLQHDGYQPVWVAGLASDQAKLLRWRSEQFTLPVSLLEDPDNARELAVLIDHADKLFYEVRSLGSRMVADALPDGESKDTRARARDMFDRGPAAATFFSRAEQALPEILNLLAAGSWAKAGTTWRDALREAAHAAWSHVQVSLGASARALRADAKYWPRFNGLFKAHLPISQENISPQEV
ncbi:type I-E CRISPR-associated protein Cse1/CasA [Bordetella genomosp. 13]|uniref:Type I-E CRISPR-associated protein Cse1/CasA n=1 Tax=Bordetella genomosp. 13 TaxID=463040 RepID=A0A1W6ZIT1_9BORD|nr:type I-E CRISPR-associated protein Cse1/CasA [Bordetella genomosp. 13]ARP96734.1 type I-E CRISPR-associated protein Cse1/CasA [Bordetella genomosp. 13]